jgi:hypothetical protein
VITNRLRQFIQNLMSNFLGCSQPASLKVTALNKALDVASNLTDKTPPRFKIEVVIVAYRSTPFFLGGRGPPSGQVGHHVRHSTMSLFQSSCLQFFESRSVLKRKLEPVGFEGSKIGSEE